MLFGLPAERIRNLTADQLTSKDQHAYLTAGLRPILLPPRLATLLTRFATTPEPQRRLKLLPSHDASRWLFLGLVPGQPIANHALTTRLSRYGINVRAARNGALSALAADLPAAVLADLLGMHIHTAVRWVGYARGEWAEYSPPGQPNKPTPARTSRTVHVRNNTPPPEKRNRLDTNAFRISSTFVKHTDSG